MGELESKKNNVLENYLKGLAGDKKNLLVDRGEGAQISASPECKTQGDNFVIIRRKKEKVDDLTADLSVISGNRNGVYPGAIIHADSNLVDGCPTLIPNTNLPRKPLKVGIDINGNTQEPLIIENPDEHNVATAINTMVENLKNLNISAAAQVSYKNAMVYDKKQIETELGIKDAEKLFGVDFKGAYEGTKKEMLVSFTQIYYTARVEPATASSLFTDTVTPDDLKNNGIDEKNPGVAMITSMDYGRQIVIKYSTDSVNSDVELAWKSTVNGTGISNNNKYKEVMESTVYNVYIYGGTTATAAKLITSTKNIDEVNGIIAADINFTKESAAVPLGYCAHYIDDGTKAMISKTSEYVKSHVETRKRIHVSTDSAYGYRTKHQKFYARPIRAVKENGEFELGGWEKLMDESSGDHSFNISGKYVEFGFSFDIVGGTDWPYSDVFWTIDNGVADNISIDWGGTCRMANIEIKVNGSRVVKKSNCSSHREHNFS